MKIYLDPPVYPLFRMEIDEDLILGLIQKELTLQWMLSKLECVGFDSIDWPVSLESIILTLIGIPRPDDYIYSWLSETFHDHITKLEENKDVYSTSEAAIEIYQALKQKRQSLDA